MFSTVDVVAVLEEGDGAVPAVVELGIADGDMVAIIPGDDAGVVVVAQIDAIDVDVVHAGVAQVDGVARSHALPVEPDRLSGIGRKGDGLTRRARGRHVDILVIATLPNVDRISRPDHIGGMLQSSPGLIDGAGMLVIAIGGHYVGTGERHPRLLNQRYRYLVLLGVVDFDGGALRADLVGQCRRAG